MSYINHRQVAAHEAMDRIYAFIHRGCATQAAVDRIIAGTTTAKALAGGRGAAVDARPGSYGEAGHVATPSVAPPTSIGVNAGLHRRAGAPKGGPRMKGKHGR